MENSSEKTCLIDLTKGQERAVFKGLWSRKDLESATVVMRRNLRRYIQSLKKEEKSDD